MDSDERYMRRVMELARLGSGNVSSNPMVGCVIVKDGEIIGEGYHERFGQPHAEVNAIHSVQDKSKLKGSTLYVNLEPCSHYGKTPPCSNLIVEHKIARVVFATIDPNPLVAGAGFEFLMSNGIEVIQGVLEEEGRELNCRFLTFMEKKRPYIILKWAETADGFIAKENFDSKWISNEVSRRLVHKWRSEEDVVLIGTNTALYDNPRLNVRDWTGRNPVRAFIDKNLQVPEGAHLLDGTQETICYNYIEQDVRNLVEYVKVDPMDDMIDVIVNDMYVRKHLSILVEGGAQLLNAFMKKGLWDEIRIFRSQNEFGTGIESPLIRAKADSHEMILDDELIVYRNKFKEYATSLDA
ncbi:bifunctional diaminohydroxyphosphoribosylaminopyrimidine deaminase/5-amino-6-(5-phosphoribosylamino)uracil reductase RibD [Cytophaga aurantiaca]|uniref:bifunctional diaminohydroxyphosphoribosylaminopyrimidine deaminase/5-amino-6-(5-phosphoribosylamino)uracil reductase RibD n=1 Tax=Cytophaga aurantiaca TaxID=29530 RepID=UPI0003606A29|nr:bifunctional diaminohydroxyphosphoribosylaminopyrimidine deaminase/5-amino-6-(5-phosphoribosylamino)uracil reductase RibD [Cytophaga aurantiaca]